MSGRKRLILIVSETAKKLEISCVVRIFSGTGPPGCDFDREGYGIGNCNRFNRVETQVFDSPVSSKQTTSIKSCTGDQSSRMA